jgi:hypothetical protein
MPEAAPQDQALASDVNLHSGYQPPSYGGYEPPSFNSFESATGEADTSTGGYEPPSYQPSSFEPPSYQPDLAEDDETSKNKLKTKSFMDDDEDIPGSRPTDKSKTEKDRENEEMFRKVAEDEGESNRRKVQRKATNRY